MFNVHVFINDSIWSTSKFLQSFQIPGIYVWLSSWLSNLIFLRINSNVAKGKMIEDYSEIESVQSTATV